MKDKRKRDFEIRLLKGELEKRKTYPRGVPPGPSPEELWEQRERDAEKARRAAGTWSDSESAGTGPRTGAQGPLAPTATPRRVSATCATGPRHRTRFGGGPSLSQAARAGRRPRPVSCERRGRGPAAGAHPSSGPWSPSRGSLKRPRHSYGESPVRGGGGDPGRPEHGGPSCGGLVRVRGQQRQPVAAAPLCARHGVRDGFGLVTRTGVTGSQAALVLRPVGPGSPGRAGASEPGREIRDGPGNQASHDARAPALSPSGRMRQGGRAQARSAAPRAHPGTAGPRCQGRRRVCPDSLDWGEGQRSRRLSLCCRRARLRPAHWVGFREPPPLI
jgi:hypothetical protein